MAAWVVRRLSSSSCPAQGATRMDDLVRSRRSREGFWKGCHLQDGSSPAFRPQNQIVDHIAPIATGTFPPDGISVSKPSIEQQREIKVLSHAKSTTCLIT